MIGDFFVELDSWGITYSPPFVPVRTKIKTANPKNSGLIMFLSY